MLFPPSGYIFPPCIQSPEKSLIRPPDGRLIIAHRSNQSRGNPDSVRVSALSSFSWTRFEVSENSVSIRSYVMNASSCFTHATFFCVAASAVDGKRREREPHAGHCDGSREEARLCCALRAQHSGFAPVPFRR